MPIMAVVGLPRVSVRDHWASVGSSSSSSTQCCAGLVLKSQMKQTVRRATSAPCRKPGGHRSSGGCSQRAGVAHVEGRGHWEELQGVGAQQQRPLLAELPTHRSPRAPSVQPREGERQSGLGGVPRAPPRTPPCAGRRSSGHDSSQVAHCQDAGLQAADQMFGRVSQGLAH